MTAEISVTSVQFSFGWFFVGFFVVENAVIDITTQVIMENIAPLHIF